MRVYLLSSCRYQVLLSMHYQVTTSSGWKGRRERREWIGFVLVVCRL